jgi:integrase
MGQTPPGGTHLHHHCQYWTGDSKIFGFASVLLERGVSFKAVADFLGHANPGFTLRTHTHPMPSSEERMRQVIEDAWATGRSALDVP